MIKVKIGRKGSVHPGFGHIVMALLGFSHLAHLKKVSLLIEDEEWSYGRWEEFFDAPQLSGKASSIEFYDCTMKDGDYGLSLWKRYIKEDSEFYLPYLCDLIKPKPGVITDITEELALDSEFKSDYLSIHLRLGDKVQQHGMSLEIAALKLKDEIDKIGNTRNIFVMTDDYRGLLAFQNVLNDRINIVSNCPENYLGDPQRIRSADNLKLLLSEINFAVHSKYFIGTASAVSLIIYSLRRLKNKNGNKILGHSLPAYDFLRDVT
ncbi:hypothetical protein NBRC116602_14540 [Hyphomicrobiales bacterium 4NK60-0047b]|jgi:hypothetical protein